MLHNIIVNLNEKNDKLKKHEKIESISYHFSEIMKILGLDLNNDSLKDTSKRVAKMYVNEIFYGLNKENKPTFKLFNNKFNYHDMVVIKDIQVRSMCEHHFLPFIGTASIAYFPNKKLLGLSKINRIVDFFARRPQLQERLTINIKEELSRILQTDDIMVFIKAKHFCVIFRGIKDVSSETVTVAFGGKFKQQNIQNQFYQQINIQNDIRQI